MFVKIIIGVALYFATVALVCIFMKGATKLANEYDEIMEAEIMLKKLNCNDDN